MVQHRRCGGAADPVYCAENVRRFERCGTDMTEKIFNQPLGGNQMPRFGGLPTMMRLPSAPSSAGLDACFVGIPLDIGTSNRPGTRYGPRQIRAESCFIRPYNMATRAAPFDSLMVADIGDVAI